MTASAVTGHPQAEQTRSAAMASLGKGFAGELLSPGSPGYDIARFSWNQRYNRHPVLVARCASVDDARRAFEYALSKSLPVAVRGGGHSVMGLSTCDQGVVIDLGKLGRLTFDGKREVIVAEAGARIGQVQALAAQSGRIVNLPRTPTISATGAVLAAGIGDLISRHGPASGSLLAAEGILADGRMVVVDEGRSPDLLWSLRGAGANFLLTTSVTLRVIETPLVYSFDMVVPATAGVKLFHRLAGSAAAYKDRLCSTLTLFGSAGAQGMLVASGLFFGSQGDGQTLVQSLTRGVEKPRVDARMTRYTAAVNDSGPARQHFASTRWARNIDPISDELVAFLLNDRALPFERFVTLNPAYGKQTAISSDEAAYAGRPPGIDVGIWADAGSPEEGNAANGWTIELWNSLHGEHFGGYPSLLESGDATRIKATYGSNYGRLRALKAKFDPSNVFNSNVNISPA
jgi:FAD/FMN-containing dehydrogenase